MQGNEFKKWGPYLSFGVNSSTEMRISWETDQYLNMRFLRYGKTNNCDKIVKHEWIEPTRHHCIILSDLEPNTQYFYKIRRWKDSDEDNKVYSFKTGPKLPEINMDDKKNNGNEANGKIDIDSYNSEFEFTVCGDIHAGDNAPIAGGQISMDKMAPNRNFNVFVGDTMNDGTNESHWQDFFKTLGPWLHQIPAMNTTGNHETNNEAKFCRFIKTWDHPYVDWKMGGYYAFQYGNMGFIMMDSCNAGRQRGVEALPSDEQYEWIEETLEKFSKKNLWIVACLHHQIFSTGDFSMVKIMEDIYKTLFDEFHVDFVFYGHDHHYEMFWPGYNDGKVDEWGGTKYIVAGGGGGQQRVDHAIMGDRDGKTKYVWSGRTYSYKRDGIIPESDNIKGEAKGARNDEFVKSSQIFGIIEPNFVHLKIKGNKCNLRCIGWQNQVYHEMNFDKNKKS